MSEKELKELVDFNLTAAELIKSAILNLQGMMTIDDLSMIKLMGIRAVEDLTDLTDLLFEKYRKDVGL